MLERTETRRLRDICERFNNVRWHDSKLVSVQISWGENNQVNEVYFDIQLLTNAQPGDYQWTHARLTLKDCTIVKLDLDLAGMHVCADDISAAICAIDSALKDRIEHEQLKYEEKPLGKFLHFTIMLVPPGGEINVFAKDFELVVDTLIE